MVTIFRSAQRPSGNGIVERNHRTIKIWAERCKIETKMAVYWYNFMAKDNGDECPRQCARMFKEDWRFTMIEKESSENCENNNGIFKVRDSVGVKQILSHFTSRWNKVKIIAILLKHKVEV